MLVFVSTLNIFFKPPLTHKTSVTFHEPTHTWVRQVDALHFWYVHVLSHSPVNLRDEVAQEEYVIALQMRSCYSKRKSDAPHSEGKTFRLWAVTHNESQHEDSSPHSASHLWLGKAPHRSIIIAVGRSAWHFLVTWFPPHNVRILSSTMWTER